MQIYPLALGFANAYLVEGRFGLLLIDTGMVGQEQAILARIRRFKGKELKLIFLTHAHMDHYGSAAALKKLTGAPLAVHSRDADLVSCGKSPLGSVRARGKLVEFLGPLALRFFSPEPVMPDFLLEDGDRLDALGVTATVVHTPGHTPGSACLFFDDGDLFVGDLVTSQGKPHVQRYFAHDWAQIPSSLRKAQSLHPERIFTGHGRRALSHEEFSILRCVDI